MADGFGLGVGQFPADLPDQPRVLRHADDVVHPVVLAPGQQFLAGIGGIGPEQDLQPGPLLAKPGDDAAERFDRAGGGIGVAGPEQGEERAAPAGDVQRQEAVVAVVAMEAPALLTAVHLVVGRVDVQDEPRRRLALPQVDEQLHEQRLQRIRIVIDPVIAARYPADGRVFETVQRALARQRRTTLPASFELVGQQGQQRVVPQIVVVVEVLVPQGDAGDTLRQQRPQGVYPEPGIAVILEARSHPVEEPDEAVDLPEQQRSGVRRDRSAVECRGYPAALEPLKYEG